MARKTEITLDGEKYEVPTLSIEQIEEIGQLYADPELSKKVGQGSFDIFRIVTADMEPKPQGKIRCSGLEMKEALQKILTDAGLQPAKDPLEPVAQSSPAPAQEPEAQ